MARLLFFSSYYYPHVSGYVTYPQQLLSELAGTHDIRVLTFKNSTSLDSIEWFNGHSVVRMGYMFRVSKGFISLSSIKHFYHQARCADAIMINLPNVEGLPLALLARFMGKPTICLFHCDVYLGKGVWSTILGRTIRLAVKWQLMAATKLVTTTEDYVKALPYEHLFANKTSYVVSCISSPVVNPKYLQALIREKQETLYIGFAGRVSREKGLEYLITSLDILRRKGIEVVLLIAGPYGDQVVGEEQYNNLISDLLDSTSLPHEFLGSLAKPELGAFYAAIDVLALPSVNRTEAFGIVQIEAMMADTPVVTTDLPGVRIPVSESGFGEIVEPGNPESLASAIERLLGSDAALDKERLARYLAQFDVRKIAARFEEILFQ